MVRWAVELLSQRLLRHEGRADATTLKWLLRYVHWSVPLHLPSLPGTTWGGGSLWEQGLRYALSSLFNGAQSHLPYLSLSLSHSLW